MARHRALAVESDPTEGFEGRQCVVEVATELLARNLGPLATPALATGVAVVATFAVIAIGLWPELLAHFPPLSTLVGQ